MADKPNLREGAIKQADQWLGGHRKSETWRLVDRLRDELTCASDEIQRLTEKED